MEYKYLLNWIKIQGLPLILEEFPESHGDTVDDEHYFSSLDGWSVGEDHLDFIGHASGMRLGS